MGQAPARLQPLLGRSAPLAAALLAACALPPPRPPAPAPGRTGLLVVRSDLRHGLREDDPRFLGYSVHARDGRLVLRSEGFSTAEDMTPLVAGEYRVVSAPAGLFLDDPPTVVVRIAGDGGATRVDLRRRR